MAIVPTMIGMIAAVMPILASALYISREPSRRATAISPTNAHGAKIRLSTMYAPAPTPTEIAAGRLRPARPWSFAGGDVTAGAGESTGTDGSHGPAGTPGAGWMFASGIGGWSEAGGRSTAGGDVGTAS